MKKDFQVYIVNTHANDDFNYEASVVFLWIWHWFWLLKNCFPSHHSSSCCPESLFNLSVVPTLSSSLAPRWGTWLGAEKTLLMVSWLQRPGRCWWSTTPPFRRKSNSTYQWIAQPKIIKLVIEWVIYLLSLCIVLGGMDFDLHKQGVDMEWCFIFCQI